MNKQFNKTWEEAVKWLKEQPDQQELVYDAFYDDPLLDCAERFYRSSEWVAVKAVLPHKQGKALDLGAGRGIASFALAKDGWEVSALEPDSGDLVGAGAIKSLSKESGLQIEVVQEWGEALPFPDGCFDLVHCRQVLHHAKDLKKLLKEISRVLKQGGKMIATREHVISKQEDLEAFFEIHPLHQLYGGEKAYLLAEYLMAIKMAGLTLKKQFNSYSSDINLYPETMSDVKKKISSRLRVPAFLIPFFILRILGWIDSSPGRLYSFIAEKP
ncbi:MAG: class I SAM-dependent methyltransferase [Deltaproteobacteria bacterium]|nr:class I SAM-dependent methyltransferase [Deltaproteobacteria bacterium]